MLKNYALCAIAIPIVSLNASNECLGVHTENGMYLCLLVQQKSFMSITKTSFSALKHDTGAMHDTANLMSIWVIG